MQFPNAHSGMQKIFISEILSVISGIIIFVMAVLAAAAVNTASEGLALASVGIAAAGGIVAIIAFILQLVGLHQGGKEEPYFKVGFWVVIISIVLKITSTSLGLIPNVDLKLVISLIDAVADVSSTIVLGYILLGIGVLATKLGNEAMARRSKFLVYVIICLFVVGVVLQTIPSFISNPEGPLATAFVVFGIVAALIDIILYVMCLIHFARAIKMLKN